MLAGMAFVALEAVDGTFEGRVESGPRRVGAGVAAEPVGVDRRESGHQTIIAGRGGLAVTVL